MGIHGASSGHSLSPLLRNVAAISRAKSPLCRHCPINIIHSAFSTSVNGDGLRLGFVSSRHEVDFEGGRAVPPENKR